MRLGIGNWGLGFGVWDLGLGLGLGEVASLHSQGDW